MHVFVCYKPGICKFSLWLVLYGLQTKNQVYMFKTCLKKQNKTEEEDARETICDLKDKRYLLSDHLQKKKCLPTSILKTQYSES